MDEVTIKKADTKKMQLKKYIAQLLKGTQTVRWENQRYRQRREARHIDTWISSALLKRPDTQVDRHMENDSLAQLARSQEQPHLAVKFTLKTIP